MTKTTESTRWFAATGWVITMLALPALAGCREDEQNRLLTYEPGVYQGQPDPGANQIDDGALRNRALQTQNYN